MFWGTLLPILSRISYDKHVLMELSIAECKPFKVYFSHLTNTSYQNIEEGPTAVNRELLFFFSIEININYY